MTGNGQLTRGAFIINDLLRNPHICEFVRVQDVERTTCQIYRLKEY